MQRIFLSGLLTLFMLLHTPARAQSLESFLADPAFTPASIGICITDVATGETLVSHNDRQAIIPASTVKVITSATALRLLGADYRTSTTVGYTGQIDSAGTLHGTLVIRGGGDPSLGSAYGSRPAEEFVDRVIDALQTHGIRAIEGTIVVDNSLFDGPAVSPKWMLEDLIWYYATGCHAFSYRDNQVRVEVRYNGHNYKTARITPPRSIDLDSRLLPGDREEVSVTHIGNRYTLTGTIPRQWARYRLDLAVDHPDSLFLRELHKQLKQAGIACTEASQTTEGGPETQLLDYPSESLAQLARSLNVHSLNLYAESLLRHIALASAPRGSAEKGLETIRRYWQPFGADSTELFLYDGSGLARNNRVSARYLTQVLAATARDPQVGETFVQSLPLAGSEGSVASFMRNSPLPGELRLKSGTMSDVHAYAGYYTAPSGKRYTIVLMFNNYTCTRTQLKEKIAAWLTATLSKKE